MSAIGEAIRTAQFIRNKCLRFWMDNAKVGKSDLSKQCAILAKKFPFANELNSIARQAEAEKAWSSIARFYDDCKKGIAGKKRCDSTSDERGRNPHRRKTQGNANLARECASRQGYPKFKKNARSVEYKTSGWKLSKDCKSIAFTDKKGIGRLKLKGTRDLGFYSTKDIKRVRLVRRTDGDYVQFCVAVERQEESEPTGRAIGLDVGLKEFYTDSEENTVENPNFYRQGEKQLKLYQHRVSRKKKGSSNRRKAMNRLGRQHLKISRQRTDRASLTAWCVIKSNDLVAYKDLRIGNLVKNHCLAKSINDAGWYQFRQWLERYEKIFGKVTVAVNPAYTSQDCSGCGETVKKSLSTRTHVCEFGCKLDEVTTASGACIRKNCDRDHNAAINIRKRALSTVGHTGTGANSPNAWGEQTATWIGENLSKQVSSLSQESLAFRVGNVNPILID